MAFTYADYHALVQALLAHPEWRAELRPLILGEELTALPDWAQRTDERLDHLAAVMAELAEAQRRTEARLDQLLGRIDDMVTAINALSGQVSHLEGTELEYKYGRQLGTYVGDVLRRARVITPYDLEPLTDAVDRGDVTATEFRRIRDLDILAQGEERETRSEMLLACELSYTVDIDDVDRAELAAATIRRLGYRARGFVAGYRIREDASARADERGTTVFLHRPPSRESRSVL